MNEMELGDWLIALAIGGAILAAAIAGLRMLKRNQRDD
jgi:hypothetical protein